MAAATPLASLGDFAISSLGALRIVIAKVITRE
jgi:hypothetical protein